MIKRIFLYSLLALLAMPLFFESSAIAKENTHLEVSVFKDEFGRSYIPQGFVANTKSMNKPIYYDLEDYKRMARYGANYQVIRVGLGRLGGWKGHELQKKYFDQIDDMIRLGKSVGIKTGLKLTVYDVKPFGEDGWDALWRNENGEHDRFIEAWKRVWNRYKDESAVFGYDLLNEPYLGRIESYEICERDYMVPLYRRLMDELAAISPEKWALYQPLIKHGTGFSPFADMHIPINRERIVYAPHIYEYKPEKIAARLDHYEKEARMSNAKMLLGEWGPATFQTWDDDIDKQLEFLRLYMATVDQLDLRGLGTVKAWFIGTLKWIGRDGDATWAIFRDNAVKGVDERKYIMDGVCRPRPLCVSGEIENFNFNFTNRVFTMDYVPSKIKAPTEIYIPANRHYPDGFRVEMNGEIIFELALSSKTSSGLKPVVTKKGKKLARLKWDGWAQRISFDDSKLHGKSIKLKVIPGYTLK